MRKAALFLAILVFPGLLFAHHGGSEYDLTKTVEFKAKLTRVDLINPHSWLYFDVTEKDGKISHHRCEMRSVHVLRRSGWRRSCFQSVNRSPLKLRRTGPISPRAICKRS